MIQNLFRSFKQHVATALARLAARLASTPPAVAAPPPSPPPEGQASDTDSLPPFSGTAEEAYLLWNSPAVALLRKKQLIRVQPDGSIPEAAEFLKLTAAGKVLARVDYILCDDFGMHGPASALIGRCYSCNRIAFQGTEPCPGCGLLTCVACSEPFEQNGQALRLCKTCKKLAELQRDNWALPSPPTNPSLPN
jgi:hypothetical protein